MAAPLLATATATVTTQKKEDDYKWIRLFWTKAKSNPDRAHTFGTSTFRAHVDMPQFARAVTQLCLAIADLAKRENRMKRARKWYNIIHKVAPMYSFGWVEHARFEDECGEWLLCREILRSGVYNCPFDANLLVKLVKQEERLGNLHAARALIVVTCGMLKERIGNLVTLEALHEVLWRPIFEIALVEARAGNIARSRLIWQPLMDHPPHYSSCPAIFYEAAYTEEKEGEFEKAIAIVSQGLKLAPKSARLWLLAIRLRARDEEAKEQSQQWRQQQKQRLGVCGIPTSSAVKASLLSASSSSPSSSAPAPSPSPTSTLTSLSVSVTLVSKFRVMAETAVAHVAPDCAWKIYFELARYAETKYDFGTCRAALVQSVNHCPPSLRWMVWMAGARMELLCRRNAVAREIFVDGVLADAPKNKPRTQSVVQLEFGRFEQFCGNLDQARAILQRAQRTIPSCHWMVYYESVLLELRASNWDAAIRVAEDAVRCVDSGRLWALLIQLKQRDGVDEQLRVFKLAAQEAPLAGEIWCEGARIALDPTSRHFDIDLARTWLLMAMELTPQFGDSFIEYMRCEYLRNGVNGANGCGTDLGSTDVPFDIARRRCVSSDPTHGDLWLACKCTHEDTPGILPTWQNRT